MNDASNCNCRREIDHIMQLLAEHEKRNTLQFDELRRASEVLERQAEHWRAAANEWRAAMDDRERKFVPRSIATTLAVVSIVSLIIGMVAFIKAS